MRVLSALVMVAFALVACAPTAVSPPSEPTLPTLSLTGTAESIDDFALGGVAGSTVVPLFELPSIPTNQGPLGLTVWGEKDGSGNVTSVAQAEVSGLNGGAGTVHVFFNAASEPVIFLDDTSGYFLAVSNVTATQATITLCDPGATPDVSTVVSNVNGTSSSGPVVAGGTCAVAGLAAVARTAPAATLGTAGETNLSSPGSITQLISAASYVAGLAFSMAAILKFKSHKDNPTQVPIGTPIALIFIAAALLFLPTVLTVEGTVIDSGSLTAVDGVLPVYETSAP